MKESAPVLEPRQDRPEGSVGRARLSALDLALESRQLLAEGEDLEGPGPVRAASGEEANAQESKQEEHVPRIAWPWLQRPTSFGVRLKLRSPVGAPRSHFR